MFLNEMMNRLLFLAFMAIESAQLEISFAQQHLDDNGAVSYSTKQCAISVVDYQF